MKFALLAFLAATVFLLSGCIQDQVPSACAKVAGAKLANCIYTNAVLDQNPYYCYSLSSTEQRQICMRDAANPAMKKKLQSALPSQRDAIFGDTPVAAKDELPPPPPAEEISAPSPGQECNANAGPEKDTCIKSEATSSKNIKLCESIAGMPVREACISEIAQKTKNVSSCSALTSQNDSNLCRTYSSG